MVGGGLDPLPVTMGRPERFYWLDLPEMVIAHRDATVILLRKRKRDRDDHCNAKRNPTKRESLNKQKQLPVANADAGDSPQ